jgi:hypothetical protein
MLRGGLITHPRLVQLFEAIVPRLFRFPAIDPTSLRSAIEKAAE